jgi:hypothetical protein
MSPFFHVFKDYLYLFVHHMWIPVPSCLFPFIGTMSYKINEYGERRAMCAYVHVPGSKVHAPGLPADVIPIVPVAFRRIQVLNIPGQKGYNVNRSQLPLLPAYAYTANKIKGQSLQYALVDLKSAWQQNTSFICNDFVCSVPK